MKRLIPIVTFFITSSLFSNTPKQERLKKLRSQVESLNKMISNMESRVNPDASRCTVIEQVLNGRMSLSSSIPVYNTDATTTSVYFHPFEGNTVTLFDGTCWKLYRFSTALSKALGTLTSGKNYDVFLYDSGNGTLALELSAAWTSDTARADALALQDGVYVKSGATGRRYLGTFRTISTTQTTDTTAKRFLWNYYNRRPRYLKITDASSSWESANTRRWKSLRNSSTNRVEFVVGINEVLIDAYAHALADSTKYYASTQKIGIGLDSTSTNSANIYSGINKPAYNYSKATTTSTTHAGTTTTTTTTTPTTTTVPNQNTHQNITGVVTHTNTQTLTQNNNYLPTFAEYMGYPSAVGYHYLQLLEYSANTGGTVPGTATSGTAHGGHFLGTNANANASGLTARIDG